MDYQTEWTSFEYIKSDVVLFIKADELKLQFKKKHRSRTWDIYFYGNKYQSEDILFKKALKKKKKINVYSKNHA